MTRKPVFWAVFAILFACGESTSAPEEALVAASAIEPPAIEALAGDILEKRLSLPRNPIEKLAASVVLAMKRQSLDSGFDGNALFSWWDVLLSI